METYFNQFLERHYIVPESVTTALQQLNWFDLIASRVNYIMENETPNYTTVVSSILQPIQDTLRNLSDLNEKIRIEEFFGELFRNLIADLFQNKLGFHEQFSEIVEGIKALYLMNGDDFDSLDELIGLSGFSEKLNSAEPIEENHVTRRLEWVNKTINPSEIDSHLKDFGLLTEDSRFEDLFTESNRRRLVVPKKYLKRFTLILGQLLDKGWIKSKGGRSTYKFVQDNLTVEGRKKPLSEKYMRQTHSNYKTIGTGEKKHKKFLTDFIEKINRKNVR